MAWKAQQVLVVLTLILKSTRGKVVPCTISGQCILPCSIDPHGGDEVIHWYNTKNNESPVHSYYLGKDQLAYQDPKYKGRTSLSISEIPSGKASLTLSDVKISDAGRYKCYTSTTKGNDETYVTINVYAPVKSVDLTAANDTLTCSSEDIYPDPVIAWSTEPPSDLKEEKGTKKQPNGLFSITSTTHMSPNITYICTVTAGDSTQWASFRQQSLSVQTGENLIIPCTVPKANLKDFRLIWQFNGDSTVLTFNSSTMSQPQVGEPWKDHLKYKQTTIELHSLDNDALKGTYSCLVEAAEFKHMEKTEIDISLSPSSNLGVVLGICIPLLIIIIVITACVVCAKKPAQTRRPTDENDSHVKTPMSQHPANGTEQDNKTTQQEQKKQCSVMEEDRGETIPLANKE